MVNQKPIPAARKMQYAQGQCTNYFLPAATLESKECKRNNETQMGFTEKGEGRTSSLIVLCLK
jgi:hypothetical protein